MKGIFQRLKGESGGGPTTPIRLTLGAFGKHPGWDDHILGLAFETETLSQVKQTLYVSGIGSQIDSGAWEKLEPEKRLAGFDHLFLWLQPGHVILGQLWSSTDGKGRAKYPMVLCIDGESVSPGFMLTTLLPGLDRLKGACRATSLKDRVSADCAAAQEQLNGMLAQPPERFAVASPSLETRQRFLNHSQLGPDRLGFLRALHELNVPASSGGQTLRSTHLRLPAIAGNPNNGLVLWAALLRCVIPEPVPVLLIMRSGTDWLDAIVGAPAPDDFFCLQASAKAAPLTTEIPYQLAPETRQQWQKVEAKFLGAEGPTPATAIEPPPASGPPIRPTPPLAPPPAPPTKPVAASPGRAATPPPVTAAASAPGPPRSSTVSTPPRPSPQTKSSKVPLVILGILVVLIAGGAGWWYFARPRDSSRPVTPAPRVGGPESVREAEAAGKDQSAAAPLATLATALANWTNHMAAAGTFLAQTNAAGAKAEYLLAGESLKEFQESARTQEVAKGLALAKLLEQGQTARQTGKLDDELQAWTAASANPLAPRWVIALLDDARARQNAAALALALASWTNHMTAATRLLAQTNISSAKAEYAAAAEQLKGLPEPAKSQEAVGGLALVGLLEQAQAARQSGSIDEEIARWTAASTNRLAPAWVGASLAAARQAREKGEYQQAEQAFNAGKYAQVLAICLAHAGIQPFDTLKARAAEEQNALGDAQQNLAAGSYGFAAALRAQSYSSKTPFATVLKQAEQEKALLDYLKQAQQTNGWQQVVEKIKDPVAASCASKPAFASIVQWAQAEAQKPPAQPGGDRQKLDGDLAGLLNELRIARPAWLTAPTPASSKPFNTEHMDVDMKNFYRSQITKLEKGYSDQGLLSDESLRVVIAEMRKKITGWD